MNAGIGFASAASGSDILFLEAMLERGSAAGLPIAVTDVLPWNNGDERAAADIERLNALIRQIAAPFLPFHRCGFATVMGA